MKSYGNLYEKFLSDENIREAIKKSSRGKRKRKNVKKIYENQEKYIPLIKKYAQNFKNSKHTPKEIYDGISHKKRTIIVPDYREQIIHHMIVNVLKPIFLKGMYEQAYGSIPKRGAHKGKKVIEKWIRKDEKNCKYILKMDIKKYFENISHEVLKNKLNRIIRDKQFLAVLFEVIDATDKGIPLGFYTSQWLSMWFLKDFDHFLKEELHVAHYMRYMDDLVIFGSNKRELHRIKKEVDLYLDGNYLELNNRWQLFRFVYKKKGEEIGRDLDFMGFRFFRNRTILRKSIMLKMTRKARKIGKKEKPTVYDCRQIVSYLGYLNACDVYNVYLDWVKPFVDFKKAKRKISKYDRRINKQNVEKISKFRHSQAA